MKMARIGIIGAGAAGLAAAISCKMRHPNHEVIVFERMNKPAKKILATGNGKANFSNRNVTPAHYNHIDFVEQVFQKVSSSQVLEFLQRLGIYPKADNEGRLYPFSDSAAALADVLIKKCNQLGVDIYLNCEVQHIMSRHNEFEVITNREKVWVQSVIITTGGKSYSRLGSNGSGFKLAEELGHSITKLVPSLAPLKVMLSKSDNLKGIRMKAKASLFDIDKLIRCEMGEVQFREKALSGVDIISIGALTHSVKALDISMKFR